MDSFSQVNEAQFYVTMSRARQAMHLFTDCKPALREAVCRPSERLSAVEVLGEEKHLEISEEMLREAQRMLELERARPSKTREVEKTIGRGMTK